MLGRHISTSALEPAFYYYWWSTCRAILEAPKAPIYLIKNQKKSLLLVPYWVQAKLC